MVGGRKGKFVQHLFWSYFLLICILLTVFSTAFYRQWRAGKRESTRQELHNQSTLLARIVDDKFSAIELTASQIASSDWLKYASAKSDILYSTVNFQKKREICGMIGNQNDSLRIAKSMAVLLAYRNLAIDKRAFWETEDYFRSIGLDEKELETIKEQLKDHYGALILYTNEIMQADNGSFAVIRRLEYSESTDKILFIYVDGRQFSNFLNNSSNGLDTLKICHEGYEVYEKGSSEESFEEIASSLYNWSYGISFVKSEEEFSGWTVVLICLGAVILFAGAIAIAWFLSSFSAKPIRRLMEKLEIHWNKEESMLDSIEKSYRKLSSQKEWMEALGNQYYQIAEEGFLSSLLHGSFDKETVEEHSKKFSLPFREEMFCEVLLFTYLGEDTKAFISAVLELEMQCYRDHVPAVFCREEGALILISQIGKDQVIRQAEHVRVMLDDMFPDLEAELHAGGAHKGFYGIGKSYNEGRERQRMVQGQMNYYYPLELEVKMINYMKLGNFADAETILKEIREENEKRNLPEREQNRVIRLIFEVCYRFSEDMRLELSDLKYDFLRKADFETYGEQWDFLGNILKKMEEKYTMDSETNNLGKELVDYVDSHYASSELSQQDMADIFHISRPAISKLFKETAKVNFIDYLHRKRVEQAKMCFDTGETDVIRVGREVGYENEVTFKRAFVKHEGVTPREYLRLLKTKGSSEK